MTFGKTNLSTVKGVNTEEILKKQQKYRDMIQQVKNSGIDIDLIIESILMDFRIESENTTKLFYKISKKGNEKGKLKFTRDTIVPFWKSYVETKEDSVKDLREVLDNKEFLSYLTGIYIIIHSENLANEVKNILGSIISEMYLRTAAKINS